MIWPLLHARLYENLDKDRQLAITSINYTVASDRACLDALRELMRAKDKFPRRLASAHEGYAVLLEEVRELEREVFMSKVDKARMRAEAVQVAAMALRFIVEVLDGD